MKKEDFPIILLHGLRVFSVHLFDSNRLQSTKDEIEELSNRLKINEEVNYARNEPEENNERSLTSKLMKQSQARFSLANRRNLSKIMLEMEKNELFSLNILQWRKQRANVLPLLNKLYMLHLL